MTVTVKHSKTNAISDWTQAQLDEQIALGNFPAGTTLANIVLPSDWNNDHTLTGVGTMAEQNANSVAITGGSVNGTTIGATTASTGKFTSVTTPSVTATTLDLALNSLSTGSVNFNSAGGQLFKIADGGAYGGYWTAYSASGSPSLRAVGSVSGAIDTNSAVPIQFRTNIGTSGAEQFRVAHTASAVNYVQVTGAATGNRPAISSQGSDTNIGLSFDVKGGPNIFFRSYGGTNNQLKISGTNASVNNHVISGGASTIAPSLSVEGSDTNISMAFQPKGTGAIDLAAGSSGVNISNGGTVTAITRTASGGSYTSVPSVVISAPTTAGGVQAVLAITMAAQSGTAVTPANGGTGYTLNDVLTVVGGTGTAAQFTVTGVSAGVVTQVTRSNSVFGTYTVLPTSPAATTGGTGTGCTLNMLYEVLPPTISNAGSGYIEQPTITFSGGGGSGASAYATVGSVPIIRSLAGSGASTSSLSFYTPAGESVRINDQGITSSGYVQLQGASATSGGSYVTSSYQSLYLSATGGQQIGFFTNGQGQTRQFNISHTASAVNYVQVTGATTTNPPAITAQGSDANIPLAIASKGTSGVRLQTAGSTSQVIINHIASAVNQIGISGNIAGSAPSLSAQGSDTNIDLALTPKGTGVVRFGTYTANMALTVQGYIEIKDSGGTLRKLAVIA